MKAEYTQFAQLITLITVMSSTQLKTVLHSDCSRSVGAENGIVVVCQPPSGFIGIVSVVLGQIRIRFRA